MAENLVESPKYRESSTELLPHASLKARVLTDPPSLFFDLFSRSIGLTPALVLD